MPAHGYKAKVVNPPLRCLTCKRKLHDGEIMCEACAACTRHKETLRAAVMRARLIYQMGEPCQ